MCVTKDGLTGKGHFMDSRDRVIERDEGFFEVLSLGVLRRTPGVSFDYVPVDFFPRIDAIDRVIHKSGAISPGPVGEVLRPWYMHPAQEDNLLVLHGRRTVELYHRDHGISVFEVTADEIIHDGQLLYDGPVLLKWERNVFHRIHSDDEIGSASLNFAIRYSGFDLDTNFSIYDLDMVAGTYREIRAGHLDQPGGM